MCSRYDNECAIRDCNETFCMGAEMRTKADSKSKRSGFVVATALILTLIISFIVASTLHLCLQEYRLSVNSSSRVTALHAAEAGAALACEELFKQIKGGSGAWSGWTSSETTMQMGWSNLTSTMDPSFDASYFVSVNTATYTITSSGRVAVATFQDPTERAIEIILRPVEFSVFEYGMLAKDLIDNSGHMYMDSFNSSDPARSTNGQYDPDKAGDNMTVATASEEDPGFKGSGNGTINGNVAVAPGGSFDLSGDFTITGDQTYDAEAEFPDVEVPFSTSFTRSSIESDTTISVSGSRDVSVPKINIGGEDHLTITGSGTCRIYIDEDVSVGGDSTIRLVPDPAGADLAVELYANKTVNISGGGVVNGSNRAINFSIWGTENCEDINYSGQADYVGTIYAPYAELKVSGQGGITGAVVAYKITYSGDGAFHFDESLLGSDDPDRAFSLVRWIEI